MKFPVQNIYFLLILLITPAFFVPLSNPQTLSAHENFMGVDEIKPGMKGYGKTVFSGDDIEIFSVEVLGVLKNWETKSDLILVKMTGSPLEETGVIAGMSGSPVYINNRLIGAVAYGWSFSKEAIAGVSPINEMKNTLLNLPEENNSKLFPFPEWELPLPPENNSEITPQTSLFPTREETPNHQAKEIKITPILSPLAMSGFPGKAMEDMKPFFSSYGLYPLQGGSCASPSVQKPMKLVPGASVAAVLVRGDLNAAVVGTVTYAEGDNIIAFGHPFLHAGTTNIPMATAYVYAILSSQSNSVKMASPVEILGQINQDRRSGIAGTIGKFSRMIPCHIEVDGARNVEYNFEVVDSKLLTPVLVLMAAQGAVAATEKKLGERCVGIRLLAKIDGCEKPLVLQNIYYEYNQTWFSLDTIAQRFAMVLNNQFQEVAVNEIDMKINITDSRQTASIDALQIKKQYAQPGDELSVNVLLKPYTGNDICETIKIKVPEDALPGNLLEITACDAKFSQSLDMGRSAGKHLPVNFEQLLDYASDMEKNNNLIVRILLSKNGLTYKGEGLPSLPPSIFSVLTHTGQSGIGPLMGEIITKVPTKYVLNGRQSIQILVK
ncbi:MAG: hypothetical protein FJ264_12255 [Planctomycetes bacterium]|nr:hypothetical protein [Planctomycetota bacterium]